nr:reverse transcriptase domain-containing protein [Tanacetum cinerariifolium]
MEVFIGGLPRSIEGNVTASKPQTLEEAITITQSKVVEQARLLAITKPEVVKVVREEAKKIRIDPKRITSEKEGKKFKKAHGAELKAPNKERNEKLRKSLSLMKHNLENYMWTIGNKHKRRSFKKRNMVVKDLMNSLSRRYERRKKILEELGIQLALLALILEHASSKSSGRKRKYMELEPKIKVSGLDYDRSLLEGVPFVNNMVIEEPEYGIEE